MQKFCRLTRTTSNTNEEKLYISDLSEQSEDEFSEIREFSNMVCGREVPSTKFLHASWVYKSDLTADSI